MVVKWTDRHGHIQEGKVIRVGQKMLTVATVSGQFGNRKNHYRMVERRLVDVVGYRFQEIKVQIPARF